MTLARMLRAARRPARRQRATAHAEQRILLFGDSHSYAVQKAVEKRRGKGRSVPLSAHRLLKNKNGKQLGDTTFEQFLDKIGELDFGDLVFSMIGGNQYAIYSIIQHPQAFDFLDPQVEAGLARGTEVIPHRMIAQLFEEGIRNGDGRSLKALRDATAARVIHIVPPPPTGDNMFIRQHHETVFAQEGLAEQGVSSPALRLKFWTLQKRILLGLCSELGIEVMLPPERTLTRAGFLDRSFYGRDATHASHTYGEILLREIESRYAVAAPAEAEA